MVYAVFTDEMRRLLRSMQGKRLLRYEWAEEPYSRHEAYGNLRLDLEDGAIEIENLQKPVPVFDIIDDMSCFSCRREKAGTPFAPYCPDPMRSCPVGERVTAIELVRDEVNVDHGAYEVAFDMALILRLERQVLMLARDVWFSESIAILPHDDYDRHCPTRKVMESWENEQYAVTVRRTKIIL